MQKTYKLLIDSPDYPMGAIAEQDQDGDYKVTFEENGVGKSFHFTRMQIENRPKVWELQQPPQEEKKVERRRAVNGNPYYFVRDDGLLANNSTIEKGHSFDDRTFALGNYFLDSKVCLRAGRRASIMFQLMNIAEEVERGSTECNGEWIVGWTGIDEERTLKVLRCTNRPEFIAHFTTDTLAGVFYDSATDLIKEWYEIK